jgi:hypothetical protein
MSLSWPSRTLAVLACYSHNVHTTTKLLFAIDSAFFLSFFFTEDRARRKDNPCQDQTTLLSQTVIASTAA